MGGTSSSEKVQNTGNKNLQFYCNEIRSNTITGSTIAEMLQWQGKYRILEENYEYIQWLFPIPNSRGININAQPLRKEEAKAIRENDVARGRVLEAYIMMLDFFGMSLYSVTDGTVVRNLNYKERYDSLNKNVYRFKYITRILKSLGELGYEKYQRPWVTFLIDETVAHKRFPSVDEINIKFWINAIKDDDKMDACMEHFQSLAKGPNALKPISYGNFESGNTDLVGEIKIQTTETNFTGHNVTDSNVKYCDNERKGDYTAVTANSETGDGEGETHTDTDKLLSSMANTINSINTDLSEEMMNRFDDMSQELE